MTVTTGYSIPTFVTSSATTNNMIANVTGFGGLGWGLAGTTTSTAQGLAIQHQIQQQLAQAQNALAQQYLAQQAMYATNPPSVLAPWPNPHMPKTAYDNTVRYRPPPLEFNRYINASDLLEEFIRWAGIEAHIRQNEALDLPLSHFITFLIIRAAEADREEPPEDVKLALPGPNWGHRCVGCGRFLRDNLKKIGVFACNGAHLDRYLARGALA